MGAYRSPSDIQYLPQHHFIPEYLTVKRVLNDFEVDFTKLTENFPEFSNHYKTKLINLSSGQKRIVEIFVILTSPSKFCLLDEPFSQVMPIHVETIKQIIRRESTGKGIIITDHLYEHILELCHEIYVINNGKTHLTKNQTDIETLGYAKINKPK